MAEDVLLGRDLYDTYTAYLPLDGISGVHLAVASSLPSAGEQAADRELPALNGLAGPVYTSDVSANPSPASAHFPVSL